MIRAAASGDFDLVFPRSRAFNGYEGITIDAGTHAAALRHLLATPELGSVWLIGEPVVGHAVVTYGFDLEFGGRDAFLTEIWIDATARGRGLGTAALAALGDELRARDVKALHLQVRRDNPAARLYARSGFVESPRVAMTRTL